MRLAEDGRLGLGRRQEDASRATGEVLCREGGRKQGAFYSILLPLRGDCHVDTGRFSSQFDFYEQFYFPFVEQWTSRLRAILGPVDESGKYLFVENVPNEFCPTWPTAEKRDEGLLLTPHWWVPVSFPPYPEHSH